MLNIFIKSLELESLNGTCYSYDFSEKINFFNGRNGTGKSEFVFFLNYMLGSSKDLSGKPWFNDLKRGTLVFKKGDSLLYFTRTGQKENNFFKIDNERDVPCSLNEYKLRLTKTFCPNLNALNDLREFADADLSIRSVISLNFLNENEIGYGATENFLSMCHDFEHRHWTEIALNYIFNPNIIDILKIKNKIKDLENEIKNGEFELHKRNIYEMEINSSLADLGVNFQFSTTNADEIRTEIEKQKQLVSHKNEESYIEAFYLNDVSERIKIASNTEQHLKDYSLIERKRLKILENLKSLIDKSTDYQELLNPLKRQIENIDLDVAFAQMVVKNDNLDRLKKIEKNIRTKSNSQEKNTQFITLDEKIKNIAIVEQSLSRFEKINVTLNIEEKKKEIKELKTQLRALLYNVDQNKVQRMNSLINELYKSAKESSDLVKIDLSIENFVLNYFEKENLIVPSLLIATETEQKKQKNYRGSKARSALIQFCGYCALAIIASETIGLPYAHLLIVDHVSQPFDDANLKGIGAILKKFYELLSKDSCQIIFFDQKNELAMGIENAKHFDMADNQKTGFIPWYIEQSKNENN